MRRNISCECLNEKSSNCTHISLSRTRLHEWWWWWWRSSKCYIVFNVYMRTHKRMNSVNAKLLNRTNNLKWSCQKQLDTFDWHAANRTNLVVCFSSFQCDTCESNAKDDLSFFSFSSELIRWLGRNSINFKIFNFAHTVTTRLTVVKSHDNWSCAIYTTRNSHTQDQ